MNSRSFLWLTIFSIAMGFMEAAVVVYLRKIYYPGGFMFPLVPIDPDIGLVEFLREAATVLMLVGIGIIAGKTASVKFAVFIYAFAVWDIIYYIVLKIFLGWPESMLTWDILFLIPLPWVGPVITPLISSLSMIAFALLILFFHRKGNSTKIILNEWLLFIAGSIIIIFSWMWDYIMYVRTNSDVSQLWSISGRSALLEQVKEYIPYSFNWTLFFAGMIFIWTAIILYYKRIKAQSR